MELRIINLKNPSQLQRKKNSFNPSILTLIFWLQEFCIKKRGTKELDENLFFLSVNFEFLQIFKRQVHHCATPPSLVFQQTPTCYNFQLNSRCINFSGFFSRVKFEGKLTVPFHLTSVAIRSKKDLIKWSK
jgi:hypothetical protein